MGFDSGFACVSETFSDERACGDGDKKKSLTNRNWLEKWTRGDLSGYPILFVK
jgi:hypothetical protein